MRAHLATLVADFRRHGKQLAVVTHRGNRRFSSTWEELAELSARCANEFGRRGLTAGDRLLIWGDNSVEWVAAFFGCVLRGVIAVPLDAAGSPEFARRVVADVSPKLLVGNRELLGKLELEAELPSLAFDAFFSSLAPPDDRPIAGLSRDTPLQIVFTSGTTAEPKGIVHTHGNVLASLDPLEKEIHKYLRYERLFHPLRFLETLPLSHVFGQFMGLWVPPLIAAEVHYEARLQAPRLIGIIRGERISVLAAVPRVLDLLRSHLLAEMPELEAKLASAANLPVWKRWWRFHRLHRRFGFKFWAFVSGGATLLPELENFWTRSGFVLVQGYGMTETTALVTLNHPFHPTQGSIGQPLAGREVQIGPDGEILVRGASIAEHVWRHGGMERRGESWLKTGDLATRNAHGDFVFAGRKSDVIVTSAGLNIHPQDLEAALRKQPAIRDAVVVAYESPTGPAPVAVLILEGPRSEDPQSSWPAEAAVAAANKELAEFQHMLYWLVWPQSDFPRTSTGKVLRRRVQSWAEQALGINNAYPTNLSDPLFEVLHQLQPATRNQEIGDRDRLVEDLRLDSLGMLQLQSALETRFGLELDDLTWQQIQTVGNLRDLLHRSQASIPQPAAVSGQEPGPSLPPQAGRSLPPASPIHGATQILPHWPWWPVFRMARIAFLEIAVRPLVWLILAPGFERRVSLKRPSLLIANHVSTFDLPIILYALPARDRHRVAVAMSGEMLTGWRRGKAQRYPILRLLTPLAYWLVTALFNVFPLPRGSGLRDSFAHAGRALDHGYHVLVFPEGGRSADGVLRTFEPGIGLLAQDSQVPVQPIYVEGLGPLKLRQRSWFRPGTVAVRFGEPLRMEPGEEPAHFAERLETAIRALKDSG